MMFTPETLYAKSKLLAPAVPQTPYRESGLVPWRKADISCKVHGRFHNTCRHLKILQPFHSPVSCAHSVELREDWR
jgi:hypothetical protein